MAGKGRPTKYKKEFCIQAEKLCKKGFIDTEIADFFEVALSTLNKWKLDHKEFSESLKRGKVHSDSAVVDALYGRALGYEFKETKVEIDAENKEKTTTTTKQMAGDTTAQIFWLKNRQPEQWRTNPEPTDDEQTGKPLEINFTIADPIREVKVTKGE